jgi:integrase
MAIEKRRLKSGKFAYVVRVRRKDRAFFPTKSFQNKSDALEYEAKLRISKGDSGTSRRCQITFGRYVEVWWKKHNFEVSESWKISQRQMLRDYILPELDRLPLAKVDKHNCQSIIERMKRLGRSDQTIRHCYNLMKRIFRCAFELDSFVSSNPISSVSPPKVNQGERSFLGNSEIHCLLEAAAGSRFDVPIRLALLAGLRIGEIQALQWTHVDLDNRLIRVSASYSKKAKMITPVKSRVSRTVPIVPDLYSVISSQRPTDAQDGFVWRRGRDSNSRDAINAYTRSRRAHSTTLPPLRYRKS